jgi:DNA repair ATPase RecN
MPRKPKKDRAQLEVMRIQGNQRAIRAETIRRERVLAPMVRVVSRRPELQQRFARDGGLVNFMLREEASQERDNFAPEIFSQQTNLYNNRFFGENIDTLTPLTELEEEFEKVKQKVSTIQKELQDCCEEIKNKLDQVSQQTKAQGEQTRRRINRKTVQILRKLQQLYDRLKAFLQEELNALKESVQNIERILQEDLPLRFDTIENQCNDILDYRGLTLKT